MDNKEALVILEQLMIENQEVLLRLKEANPKNYSAEKIFKNFHKPLDKSKKL